MSALLSVLWLLLAFAMFMALVWSVYAVNRAASRRFGYEPFALPNAALMLVVNLLLLSALAPTTDAPAGDGGWQISMMLAVAAALSLALLVVITRRSNLRYALYAVALMGVGAIAVLPSLIFMRIATSADPDAPERGPNPAPRTDPETGTPTQGDDPPA